MGDRLRLCCVDGGMLGFGHQRAGSVRARLRVALVVTGIHLDADGNQDSNGRTGMTRPAVIPPGSWPRRMPAALAAGYVGESTVEAFVKRVGTEYPAPRVNDGRRKLWMKEDLDRALGELADDPEFRDASADF